mmetsp:Transcript_10708/g.26609  ORF Transcript_10708/g.26609 Transcript_10708/m.26609 type:complete len:167 (+) Transcript_10708:118-618(+)
MAVYTASCAYRSCSMGDRLVGGSAVMAKRSQSATSELLARRHLLVEGFSRTTADAVGSAFEGALVADAVVGRGICFDQGQRNRRHDRRKMTECFAMLLCTAVVIAMRCECEDVTVVWSGTIFCTSRTFPVSLSSRCQIALGSECLSCADLLGTWSAIFTNRQHERF